MYRGATASDGSMIRRKFIHLFCTAVMLFAATHATALAQPLVLSPVTVIDVREGVARPEMTVVVTGERITAVGPVDEIEIPTGARVVDATGKYLIPGLWDMHVHVSHDDLRTRSLYLPLFVAHGVTGIREMSGQSFNLQQRKRLRRARSSARAWWWGGKLTAPIPGPRSRQDAL